MKTMAEALKGAGKAVEYMVSSHAMERIRQRVGITTQDAARAWVAEQVRKSTHTKNDKHKTHYVTELFEIVCDGIYVITVKPSETANPFLPRFNEMIAKESTKLLTKYRRELRKAEISVAEAQLNYLRAKNPKTREIIQRRMTEVGDERAALEDRIKQISLAAKQYGIEV